MYYQDFGPWHNYHGYTSILGIIDDLYVLKTRLPDGTISVTYHFTEESVEQQIELHDQDRRY